MVIRRLDNKAMGCSRLAKEWGASVVLALGLVLAVVGDAVLAQSSDFERDIAPLLLTRCMECHHPRAKSGGLDLSSRAGLLQGGDSGPAIDLEHPRQSPLIQKVMEGVMPPVSRGISQKLPEEEIRKIEQWLVQGTPWPESRILSLYERTTSTRGGKDWWSLQPIAETKLPLVDLSQQKALPNHPIDLFIEPVLIEKGLVPAPKADRETLLRRAYFDLLGLAPDRSEVESFLSDQGPDAWERWIDRLLASPRYGERWARYWLDLVRFAETCGYERDQLKPNLWRYRDWVIRSLNRDVPFDRFIAEQLAGDELPDASEETWVATGMLRAGTWNDEPNDPADYLYERIEDLVDVTSTAFLGMTVKCARCHDHKFDPIPQTDYYRMASFFWPGYLGQSHLGGPPKEKLPNNVFGWTDRGSAVDPIHLLIKGDRQRPGEIVEPGFLSMIDRLDRALSPPSPQSSTTGRRLQLAQWMSHRDNPLTARVAVNRIWQHHFGQGLVATADNFGFKSAPPTHPALLDWLAATFMAKQATDNAISESDALAWSVKRLHRTIMTSEAYQRSSLHPESERWSNATPTIAGYGGSTEGVAMQSP